MEIALKAYRKKLGISQDRMAKKIGVCRETYIKYEADPDRMTIEHLKRFCEVLGITLMEFLSYQNLQK